MLILATLSSTSAALIAAGAAIVAAATNVGAEFYANHLRRRGVAILISEDLSRWEGPIVEAFYRNKWWAQGDILPPLASSDDLKLAATDMEQDEWSVLGSARRWVEFLETTRSWRVTEQVGHDPQQSASVRPTLRGDERRWLEETFYRLEVARWARCAMGCASGNGPGASGTGALTAKRT